MPDSPDQTPPGVQIPEDLTTLTREQLVDLEAQLLARFEALREESTPDAVAEMGRIAQTLPQVGDQVDVIDTQVRQAAEAADSVGRYQSRATPPAPPETSTPDTTGEATAAVAPEVIEPAEVVMPDAGTDLAVAANRNAPARRTVADIAARAPRAVMPAGSSAGARWFANITAGAEIPGVPASAEFASAAQFCEALVNRTQALVRSSSSSKDAVQASATVARAHLPQLGEVITASESASHVTLRMMQAVEDWRNTRQRRALTADTGFCAPTETIWDLCDPYVADGMVSLPEIPITRGGIKHFPMPDLSCFTNYSWEFGPDELECMNKPCLEIPCPEPEEIFPGVIGACLTAGILQTRAFPELVERYVRGVVTAHMMLISKRTLQQMEAGSIPVIYDDTIVGGAGFTAALLNSMEFQAVDLREDYLLAESEVLAVDIPQWVRGAIRADLANRPGVDLLDIDNAYIDRLFTERGFNPTWIKGWQNECVGAPGAQRAYPTTVRYLIYREGAWVRGLEPVIEFESMYDSVLLRQNKYTRLFTEQAIMLANLCTKSRVVTVPVCPNGATQAGVTIDCFAEACTTPVPPVCPPNVECPPLPCCEDPTPAVTP